MTDASPGAAAGAADASPGELGAGAPGARLAGDAAASAPNGHAPAPRSELRGLLVLAAPLAAGSAGNQLMAFVDTAMVGRLGSVPLAAVGMGNSLFFSMTTIAMGCVMGMDPLVAQAIGAGEHARARQVLRRGIRLALVIAVPLLAALALTPLVLEPIGIEPATARMTASFVYSRLPNAVPILLFVAARAYLQALGKTRALILGVVVANVANVIGNALLIYGDAALLRVGLPAVGLPALGVVGSGLSSSLASLLQLALLAAAIRSTAVPGPPAPSDPALGRSILRLGLPIGLHMFAEFGAFALTSLFAGRMGAVAVAGHQVALTLASVSFTVTLGLGSATAVRVGHAVGRGDAAGARRAGFLGLAVSGVFMAASAVVFLAAPAALARILTDDPRVLAASLPLVMIAAAFQLSDGAQVVAAGAVRGAGETRATLVLNLVGHYAIGMPLALALGFGAGLGAPGLWWGLSAGLTFVAIALTLRFHRMSADPRRLRRV